jgi:hypothetical protein
VRLSPSPQPPLTGKPHCRVCLEALVEMLGKSLNTII